MGITSELRTFIDAMDKTRPYEAERLCKVADRIDAEHERILRETGEEIVADVRREWIRLLVDEDGAPIRIGDVMRFGSVDRDLTVLGIGMVDVGGERDMGVYVLDGDNYMWYNASHLHHHHAPTVEDVLREFALACEDAGNAGPEVARIAAEYAKRLTLADGEGA